MLMRVWRENNGNVVVEIRIECGGGGYSRGKTIECGGGGKRWERRGIISCLQWIMKGEGNITCIIMMRLSNLESRINQKLFLVFSQPIKTHRRFIDLDMIIKPVKRIKPPKNST